MEKRRITRNGSVVELAPERAFAVQLRPGSRIVATAGTVWLTQDGMLDDVVLTPGKEFVVPSRGTQVLSAVDAPATVRIIDIDSAAHALRRAEMRRWIVRLRLFFRRLNAA